MRAVAVLAATVMMSVGVSTAAEAHSPASPSNLRAEFDAMARADIVSAIAELRDGASVQRFSAGTTELGGSRPAPPAGRYRAGSVTKTFVATVILQLVGEGRIALSDPVERWLPGVLPNGQAVTIRDLLGHSSGVYDYTQDLLPSDHDVLHIRSTTFPARRLVDIAIAHGPQFAPGTQQQYSNTDYILLGMVIGKVTGRPYGEEVQRRIIRPLGLTGTSVPGTFPFIIGPTRTSTSAPAVPPTPHRSTSPS
ncbi:serine hydrolase domain-containing protein [Dactylosporangium sp. CA-233914]|uniref:serine hydrolase domain-containing protein n=1 Tax=Dactylosporangium sp. CA-233914 TaxID=3239934 RepID=UPI003D8FFEF3